MAYNTRHKRPFGKYGCRFMDVDHRADQKWNVDVTDDSTLPWEVLIDKYFTDEEEALKFWNQLDKHIFVALSRL